MTWRLIPVSENTMCKLLSEKTIYISGHGNQIFIDFAENILFTSITLLQQSKAEIYVFGKNFEFTVMINSLLIDKPSTI